MRTSTTFLHKMGKLHAKYSPSSSDRWLGCPGCIQLCDRLEAPPTTTKYAEEGTRAHAVLERFVKNPTDLAKHYRILSASHPKRMLEFCEQAATTIFGFIKEAGRAAIFHAERRVGQGFIPEMWGSLDAAVIQPFRKLHIIDFKYGSGVLVQPEQNPQLIFYALAQAHEYGFDFGEVDITIIQPRIPNKRGPVRTWHTTMKELLPWEKTFREGIKESKRPGAPLRTGSHCRWCPAVNICPQVAKANFEQAQADFESRDFLEP